MLGTFFSATSIASQLTQEKFNTHLRWRIKTPQDQISVKKEGNKLFIKTLNEDFYQKVVADLVGMNTEIDYFSNFQYSKAGYPERPAEIIVDLKDESIELFSFYKEKEQTYVLDFWINQDVIKTNTAALVKTPEPVKETPKPKTKKVVKKTVKKVDDSLAQGEGVFNIIDPESIVKSQQNPNFRDFRYGASFLKEHAAFIPPIEKDILLNVKGPDYLYQIKDRNLTGDPKEAHMQLSINFFRAKKWGLMTKSINLYEKKYGKDSNQVYNEFMKATVLIKNTIKEEVKPQAALEEEPVKFSEKGTFAAGLNLLNNVMERTDEYELKQAVIRYLLQASLDKNDHVKALQLAKNLYITATENFDDTMSIYSSRVILYSLAQLRQLDKIAEFLENKAVQRLLPKQEGIAFQSYVNLMNNNREEVIKAYSDNKASFAEPVHPAIVYNTAEAMFREARYEEALKLYDYFLVNYSGLTPASRARLTLALCYDLLDKPVSEVLKLYQDAINRSADAEVSYEAKLRYVGLRIARNLKPDEADLETVAFLTKSPAEAKATTDFHKKLLWQVRLRYFIVTEQFEKALAYVNSIPLNTLHQVDRRVFEGDGAEIVVGLIKKHYLNGNYSSAVKTWEVYKDKYEKKVAKSPYLGFVVADSFLKLGLHDSFNRAYSTLKKAQGHEERTFPQWVSSHKRLNVDDYMNELELLQSVYKKDWPKVSVFLDKLNPTQKESINYNYYKGLVFFHQKNYKKSIELFEKILAGPNENNMLNHEQNIEMLLNYVEALYQNGESERFRKNALALSNDIEQSKSDKVKAVNERVYYLLAEDLFGEAKKFKALEKVCRKFIGTYPASEYIDRITYIFGHTLLKNKRNDDAKEVLTKLIEKESAAEYLKGLARSELSSLAIKEKTL